VKGPELENLSPEDFVLGPDGKPTGLVGPRARIVEQGIITETRLINGQQRDVQVARNPWKLPTPGADGSFVFGNEPLFPPEGVQRDAQGRPVLGRDGLQIWAPRDTHLAQTTAFEGVNHASKFADSMAGRRVLIGNDGQISINTHDFVGLNAFYNPGDRGLHFGLVPYTLNGERRLFEMATSWEVVVHETGHAIHDTLKPLVFPVDPRDANPESTPAQGFRQWGESFGDQLAMWSSLSDPERRQGILAENGGDMSKPSALTKMLEAFGPIPFPAGPGDSSGPLRSTIHDLTVATTSPEEHERGEVLNGAMYEVFQDVFKSFKADGLTDDEALARSGDAMGKLLVRSTDYTPDNTVSLEDVGKGYLKVDKELFGGRFGASISRALEKRGIFDRGSVAEFQQHEASLPRVQLSPGATQADVERLIQQNQDALGARPGFGLSFQGMEQDEQGRTIVRVGLMEGRDANAKLVGNTGTLVFRPDGTLEDSMSAWPSESLTGTQAKALLDEGRRLGLDRQGIMSLVPRANGSFTVKVFFTVQGQDAHRKIFSLDDPKGHRVELVNKDPAQSVYGRFLPKGARLAA
jgi:hypothetical protein